MKAVDSKYQQFPFALTFPDRPEGADIFEFMESVRGWLHENGLQYNRDYLNFDHVEFSGPREFRKETVHYTVAFKSKAHALMFKMAWA